MKQIQFDKPSLRWWGIFAICLIALVFFITNQVSNSQLTNNDIKLSPKALSAIIWQSMLGVFFTALILFLAWQPAKNINSQNQNEKNQYSWLKDNLPFGVAIWSQNGTLLNCNAQYLARLNFKFNEINSTSSYVEVMKKIKLKNNYKIISDQELIRQIELNHSDGTSSLIDERPLNDGGFISMVFDISEKVKAQETLEKIQNEQRQLTKQLQTEKIKAEAASRSKTSFLAHLSHDVRTPLNHIIGFSELISHETFGPIGDKKYLKYIKDIKISGERLLDSFSEILDLAQLESGDLILKAEKIELSRIMKSTLNRFSHNAKRAGITLETDMPDNVELMVDRMCLERMINNLVENSVRFTPNGGKIKITSWLADDGIVLEISDTGIGISKERLKELSQPFVLGDSAFTKKDAGVGLGISISRAIAELNGGKLAIDSSPSIGTTVAVSLPILAKQSKKLSDVA